MYCGQLISVQCNIVFHKWFQSKIHLMLPLILQGQLFSPFSISFKGVLYLGSSNETIQQIRVSITSDYVFASMYVATTDGSTKCKRLYISRTH
jgi:hypothetical protein